MKAGNADKQELDNLQVLAGYSDLHYGKVSVKDQRRSSSRTLQLIVLRSISSGNMYTVSILGLPRAVFVSLMYEQEGLDTGRYVGRNEHLAIEGNLLRLVWGYQEPEVTCQEN